MNDYEWEHSNGPVDELIYVRNNSFVDASINRGRKTYELINETGEKYLRFDTPPELLDDIEALKRYIAVLVRIGS